MTTKALKQNQLVVGQTYDGTNILGWGSSIAETQYISQCVPPTGAPSSIHRAEFSFSNDNFTINDIFLDITAVNSDANAPTFKNVFMILSDIKMLVNNSEHKHLKNREEIYNAVSDWLKKYNESQYWGALQNVRSEVAKTYSGETIAASSSKVFCLPILSVLFPEWCNSNLSQGISKIAFEFSFNGNLGTAALNGRFVLSNTTSNAYGTNITFTNMQTRIALTRFAEPKLYNLVQNPLLINNKYEVKEFPVVWNATTDLQRVSLNTDFSKHNYIKSIACYLYPSSLVTAYNDADCCKVYSDSGTIGFEVKFRTKSIIKMDLPTDFNKRVNYHNMTNWKRNGVFLPPLIHDSADGSGQFYIPTTCIDFSNVDVQDSDTELPIGGVTNANSDIEIILTNVKGSWATSATLYVCLQYYEIMSLDPKTGKLNLLKS